MLKHDLYLSESHALMPEAGVITRLPASGMSPSHRDLLALCSETCREDKKSVAFSYGGDRYRASLIKSQGGPVYCLRRFAKEMPSLDKLRINEHYVNQLLNIKSGLVLVSGETCSGKTTTCSAFVAEYIRRHGGIAITVEDPVEMPLEGFYGTSAIYQIEADSHGGFGQSMRDVVRMSPNLIFMGEVRDTESAIEVIKAAINGHLIVATIHAPTPIDALLRIAIFAEPGFPSGVDRILSRGISAVMGQELISRPGGIFVPKNEFISFVGEYESNRDFVKSGRHHQLTSTMAEQHIKAKYGDSNLTSRVGIL